MNSKLTLRHLFAGLVFLLVFVVIGLSFWLLPYNQVSFPSSLFTVSLWSIPFGALLLRCFGITPWWLASLLMGTTAPATVWSRVIVDCANDPTSHNLWPLEIILASFVSYPLAIAGALAGLLLGKSILRQPQNGKLGNSNAGNHV